MKTAISVNRPRSALAVVRCALRFALICIVVVILLPCAALGEAAYPTTWIRQLGTSSLDQPWNISADG